MLLTMFTCLLSTELCGMFPWLVTCRTPDPGWCTGCRSFITGVA